MTSTESTDAIDSPEALEAPAPPNGVDRRGLAVAAALVLACGGLVGYGIFSTEDKPEPRAVPTASVTYEVTGEGTAEISYLARSEAGEATVIGSVDLPWKKTVHVPIGKAPTVNITLDKQGGQASCTLAIRGKHVQRATALGQFGRATCTGGPIGAANPAGHGRSKISDLVRGW